MKRNLSLFLLFAGVSLAASQRGSSTLSVTIRPEVLLTSRANTVNLKIRLSEGASAQLWIADACAVSAVSVAMYTVSESGTYQIPVSSLAGSGKNVCLSSTDGLTSMTGNF